MINSMIQPNRLYGYLPAIGLVAIMLMGVIACFTLVIASLWALAQFLLVATQAIVETANEIASTFNAADPLVRFLMLVSLGYALYRVVKHVRR